MPAYRSDEWVDLESSLIARLRFREETATLEVELVGGRVYRFFDVPLHRVARFCRASSPGRFFNREIRDCYRYQRLTPRTSAAPLPPGPPSPGRPADVDDAG